MSGKEKFALYLTPEKKAILERRFQEDGSRSMTAFIERAVDFYLDYLSANSAGLFLPTSIKSYLDGRLGQLEDRLSSIAFRQAVEQDMVAGILADAYLTPVTKHLIPYFGKLPINEIRPIQIQEYINQMSKTYAPETVKKDFTILSFILQHAVENGLCQANPALRSIRIPKIERADKTAYTQEEYDKAYTFAKDHPDGLPIMLMMETGISRSELLGLRWEDIDTKNKVLHIRQGLVAYQDLEEKTWVIEADGLKNDYRRRDIPLTDDDLIERLKKKPRTIYVKYKGASCEEAAKPEFVFHSPEGLPYQPNNWSNRVFFPFMRDLLKAHPELPSLSPHELRHTRATLWIAQGIDPYMVARLLGHSDVKMLAKVYDHTTVDTLREAITSTKKKEVG